MYIFVDVFLRFSLEFRVRVVGGSSEVVDDLGLNFMFLVFYFL